MTGLFFVILGYLSGSILFAYYLPLWVKRIDITADTPDGNPGVFNCMAKAGRPLGILALMGDLSKGALPVFWAAREIPADDWALALVIAAPVAGHAFPLFRHFHGGKSITVTFGVLLGLLPKWEPVALLAACYLIFSLILRVNPHRARSLLTFLCFGAGAAVKFQATPIGLGCLLSAGVVLSRHRRREPGEERPSVRILGKEPS